MAVATKPNEKLAEKTLPKPLRRAIELVFSRLPNGVVLVGGTALAGYYAGHRRSDDMDLFTADQTTQQQAVQSVKALKDAGASLSDEISTPTYYHALIEFDGHTFTADVVLDQQLHRIAAVTWTTLGVAVIDLETLLKMKVAALVSRCSEKDLYDLLWLTTNYRDPGIAALVALGSEIDAGVDAETLLISLTGAKLRLSACDFATTRGQTPQTVLESIEAFQHKLESDLANMLEGATLSAPIAKLIRKLSRKR